MFDHNLGFWQIWKLMLFHFSIYDEIPDAKVSSNGAKEIFKNQLEQINSSVRNSRNKIEQSFKEQQGMNKIRFLTQYILTSNKNIECFFRYERLSKSRIKSTYGTTKNLFRPSSRIDWRNEKKWTTFKWLKKKVDFMINFL